MILDPKAPTAVNVQPIYSKCGWSPFADQIFPGSVYATYVNGHEVYKAGQAKLIDGAWERLAILPFF